MANHSYPEQYNLLHKYFDGELNQRDQETLFGELENDAALRKQFNQHMKLRSMMKTFAGNVSVPAVTTHQLFNRMGFAQPEKQASPAGWLALLSGGAASLVGGLGRHKALGLTAAASVLITSLVMLTITSEESRVAPTVEDANIPHIHNSAVDSPLAAAGEQSTHKQEAFAAQPSATEAMPAPASEAAGPESHTAVTGNDNTPTAAAMPAANTVSENNVPLAAPASTPISAAIALAVPSNPASPTRYYTAARGEQPIALAQALATSNPRFSVEIGGLGGPSGLSGTEFSPNTNIGSESATFLDNTSISLFFALDGEHSFGLSAGRERFGQEFTFREADGRLVENRQEPMLSWYGVDYRYSGEWMRLFNTLSPFTQFTLGYAESGVISRATLGLTYSPMQNVSLRAGMHGGTLWYDAGGASHTTFKWGFSYGVAVRMF